MVKGFDGAGGDVEGFNLRHTAARLQCVIQMLIPGAQGRGFFRGLVRLGARDEASGQ